MTVKKRPKPTTCSPVSECVPSLSLAMSPNSFLQTVHTCILLFGWRHYVFQLLIRPSVRPMLVNAISHEHLDEISANLAQVSP